MTVLAVFCLLSSALFRCDLESGWKGIRVFESNKSDIERAFGRKVEGDEAEARYETVDAAIRVLYSTGPCADRRTLSGGFRTKAETVIQYEVVPKNALYLKDLKAKLDQYSRYEDTHVVGLVEYYDKEHAIRISTLITASGERVRTISFGRTEKQTLSLQCE